MSAPTATPSALPRTLRHFAWSLAALLALLAWILPQTPALRILAALVFALGTVLPRTFHWPFVAFLFVFKPLVPDSWKIQPVDPTLQRRRRPRRLRRANG